VKAITSRRYPRVTVDGTGVVSHAGTALVRELADRVGLTGEVSVAVDGIRRRAGGHDPGQVLVDLAVMLADGGEAIRDIASLADQPGLHGPVASPATAWRVLDAIDAGRLGRLRQARAAARERGWLARGEIVGEPLPPARAAGRDLDYVVVDLDATLVEVHSDKEQAAGHFKGGFGYHPLLAFLDNTNEALAGILRPGSAGSNTAADHIEVLGLALAQLPDAHRAKRILVRTDGAGFSHAFLDHLVEHGLEYSVGFAVTDDVRAAITRVPRWAWTPAVDAAGGLRDGAEVVDVTGMLDLTGWPDPMRVIVRRERPHPGAQLDAFEHRDGYRYQAMATNTPVGQLAFLEARHRAHARVEDRIRQLQDAGAGRLPSRMFTINAIWLELALTAADLLAFTQTILLTDQPDLARAEWKTIRYRLLHTAARITRGARQTWLRLAEGWPWALALARAFTTLRRIPLPA
jgi:Transposase DDE domain group 1